MGPPGEAEKRLLFSSVPTADPLWVFEQTSSSFMASVSLSINWGHIEMVLSPGLWFCLVPGGTTHSSAPPPARAALGAAVRMREDCPLYSALSSTWTTLGKLQAAFRGRKERLCHRSLCSPLPHGPQPICDNSLPSVLTAHFIQMGAFENSKK